MQRAAATSELKPTNILAPFSVISSTKNFFPRDTMRNAFMQRIWRRGSAAQCVELRQARLFIALATVRPYRHHRGADLGAELE